MISNFFTLSFSDTFLPFGTPNLRIQKDWYKTVSLNCFFCKMSLKKPPARQQQRDRRSLPCQLALQDHNTAVRRNGREGSSFWNDCYLLIFNQFWCSHPHQLLRGEPCWCFLMRFQHVAFCSRNHHWAEVCIHKLNMVHAQASCALPVHHLTPIWIHKVNRSPSVGDFLCASISCGRSFHPWLPLCDHRGCMCSF